MSINVRIDQETCLSCFQWVRRPKNFHNSHIPHSLMCFVGKSGIRLLSLELRQCKNDVRDNVMKIEVICFLISQLVHFWICLNHKVNPKGFNASVPSHTVESLSKEVFIAVFVWEFTDLHAEKYEKQCSNKKKKKKESKHTYHVFQLMFDHLGRSSTVLLTLAFTTQSEFCPCTKKWQKNA